MNLMNTFLDLMEKGGPVMWIIFSVACIAFIMLAWQFIKTFILKLHAEADYKKLKANHSYTPDTKSCSPIARIFRLINWQEATHQDELSRQLNIYFTDIMPKLEGTLPTVATLGTLLPMLGLLGTVTGMINVFEVIALHGSGKPEEMAHGISQALLTTASGLVFAIPIILLHHLMTQKINALLLITSQSMQFFLHRDIDTLFEASHYDGH